MAYDPLKEKILAVVSNIKISENESLVIDIFTYNGGAPKVRIMKKTTGSNGKIYHDSICKLNKDQFHLLMNNAALVATYLE